MTVTINGTTGIAGVDGSAATPAVQGVDTNTGVFYGTDIVAVSTGGTEQVRVASAGQIGIGGANYGTSGQVLTSGGSAAAPSWTTVSATGNLLRAPQILTSGTSYTTPAGCIAVYVECVGGGGGGGGARNTDLSAGGGGGGGAYAAKYFTVTASTSYTIAIGAGGTAGISTGGTGGTGGSTTFLVSPTTVTAAGGLGGAGSSSQNSFRGGAGGVGTNGDLNIRGNPGGYGLSFISDAGTVQITIPGTGGGSGHFGGGASLSSDNNMVGIDGLSGGGGSGGNTPGGTSRVGGAGGVGFIRVWEYS